MTIAANFRILSRIILGSGRGATQAERLENFYRGQAEGYDNFRKRLLPSRAEFFRQVAGCAGLWVDMGCGTGECLEFMQQSAAKYDRALLVDLCPSLLKIARQRSSLPQYKSVEVQECDISAVSMEDSHADLVTFCYSLSMVPDWIEALEHAVNLLRPGGTLAIIDFYVSRTRAADGLVQHSWATRSLLPLWFARDDVMLRSDVLPWLRSHLDQIAIEEGMHRLPYVGLAAPYFYFIGRKPH